MLQCWSLNKLVKDNAVRGVKALLLPSTCCDLCSGKGLLLHSRLSLPLPWSFHIRTASNSAIEVWRSLYLFFLIVKLFFIREKKKFTEETTASFSTFKGLVREHAETVGSVFSLGTVVLLQPVVSFRPEAWNSGLNPPEDCVQIFQ